MRALPTTISYPLFQASHLLRPTPSQVPVPSCRFRFFVGKTLLPISLGQLSLKASQLPSGFEPVSHRFDETSIPSALVTLPVGAIPVPSLHEYHRNRFRGGLDLA